MEYTKVMQDMALSSPHRQAGDLALSRKWKQLPVKHHRSDASEDEL
jgi:hypothetical protein